MLGIWIYWIIKTEQNFHTRKLGEITAFYAVQIFHEYNTFPEAKQKI